MWKDFKAFLMRGNVIDLATAVVIGAAFGKIVTALVDNIIMPCIGMLTSGVDFANMKYVLKEGTLNAEGVLEGEVAIGYGILINAVIQFIIIAFVIFIVIRLMIRSGKHFLISGYFLKSLSKSCSIFFEPIREFIMLSSTLILSIFL